MVLTNPNVHLLTDAEIRKVQTLLLSMMDDIHAFCKKHGIRYVMSGGCALGAIRHGGFIPWDDDIDLSLPRSDYERFCRLFPAEFADRYELQEVRRTKGYDLNFAKIRKKGTRFVEPLDSDVGSQGVFIDLFPVENVRDFAPLRGLQWFLSDGLQFVCSCIRIRKKRKKLYALAGDDETAKKAIRQKSVIALPFCILPFRAWLLLTEWVLRRRRNPNSRYVAIPTGGKHFKGETYPRDWLFPPKEMDFAGHTFCAMNRPRNYLSQMYGDYETIPPEEKRERHALLSFSIHE